MDCGQPPVLHPVAISIPKRYTAEAQDMTAMIHSQMIEISVITNLFELSTTFHHQYQFDKEVYG